MYTTTALVLLALAVHGTAAVNLSPELFHGHTRAVLHLRQTIDPGEIPAQCQSQCAVAVQALNGCTDLTCLCTTRVNTGLTSCFNCILPLSVDADGSLHRQSQQSVASYEDGCNAGGFPLPSLTISGAAPPATSAPPSSSSTSATFSPTSSLTQGTATSQSISTPSSSSSSDTGVFSISQQPMISHSTVSGPIQRSTVGADSSSAPSSPAASETAGGGAGVTGGNGAIGGGGGGVSMLATFVAVVVGFAELLA